MSAIDWLQEFYKSNCNGDWEHTYGIRIDTLDNPGWCIEADLSETPYSDIEIKRTMEDNGNGDWMSYKIEKSKFEGFGDPSKLEALIWKFRDIILQHNRDSS